MNPTEQIKALAELDGWTEVFCEQDGTLWGFRFWRKYSERTPDFGYLTSYDCIIPLIQKQDIETRRDIYRQLHREKFDIVTKPTEVRFSVDIGDFCSYTVAQLCEALLRATGKWKD